MLSKEIHDVFTPIGSISYNFPGTWCNTRYNDNRTVFLTDGKSAVYTFTPDGGVEN